MKKNLFLLVVLCTIFSFAQTKPSILISRRYDFQKSDNSYNLNNMFYGILSSSFNVYFEGDELPIDIAENKCNALSGFLVEDSGMFNTKVKFIIKDCQNKTVFESAEMKSKEKDYQVAYNEVMRLLAPEVKKFAASYPKVKKEKDLPLVEVHKKEVPKSEFPKIIESETNAKHKLIEMTNGFAVMDANQKIVLQIYITTNPKVFIADKFGVKGVFTILENGTKGLFEYYLNDKLIGEEFQF